MKLKPTYKLLEFDTEQEFQNYMLYAIFNDRLSSIVSHGNKMDVVYKEFTLACADETNKLKIVKDFIQNEMKDWYVLRGDSRNDDFKGTRICTRCGEEKPFSAFSILSYSRRLTSRCKKCQNELKKNRKNRVQ